MRAAGRTAGRAVRVGALRPPGFARTVVAEVTSLAGPKAFDLVVVHSAASNEFTSPKRGTPRTAGHRCGIPSPSLERSV